MSLSDTDDTVKKRPLNSSKLLIEFLYVSLCVILFMNITFFIIHVVFRLIEPIIITTSW